MAAKAKTVFVCSACGCESPKWYGKCPSCGEWNTMAEEVRVPAKTAGGPAVPAARGAVRRIGDINPQGEQRYRTGLQELDRVLGGGIVRGGLMLIGGDPGIGKSTLLLQICAYLGQTLKILYVSGEESERQIKMRADRLGVENDNLYVLCETDVDTVIGSMRQEAPDLVIVDSIQTMNLAAVASSPGSVTQVRECAAAIMRAAKQSDTPVFVVGHVNKDGAIAGPKVLEHMVDAVLYFEGDKQHIFRIIRAAKNRFGSTNEIGVFEMLDDGLREVENPSELLMTQRQTDVSGSCAVCVIEGSRPIIAEIQALASPTVYPSPRRMSAGIDYNRLSLLLAVLEKRLGLKFSTQDVYLSVAGGLRLDEPSADMSSALALISTLRDLPVREDLIAFGEIGLSGECRAVTGIDIRIHESRRLGFKRIAIPYRALNKLKANTDGVEIIPIRSVFDLLKLLG